MKKTRFYLMLAMCSAFIACAPFAKADIAVDFLNSDDDPLGTPASIANFQAADSLLDSGTAVTAAFGIAGFTGLGVTDGSITATTTNGSTFFREYDLSPLTTFASNQPIIDEGIFLRDDRNDFTEAIAPQINLSGLSSVTDGDLIRLTLYGVGSQNTEQAIFTGNYGTTVLTGETNFENAVGFVNLDFTADGTDALLVTINRNEDVSDRAFFSGFSVSTSTPAQVPEPSSLALFGLGIVGMVTRRRR